MCFEWFSPWGSVFSGYELLPKKSSTSGWCARHLNQLACKYGLKPVVQFDNVTKSLSALEYERSVIQGVVPTRDDLHDWYNGLVWLLYPKTKQAITQSHVKSGCDVGSGNGRNALRNTLTLFDENGALLLTSQRAVMSALVEHDWHTVFIRYREHWHSLVKLYVFGHGLLEALDKPYKGLCAKVWVMWLPEEHGLLSANQPVAFQLDELLASQVELMLRPKQLQPLPVMGVPGWFFENQAPGFYNDTSVFRPKPTDCLKKHHSK